MARLSAAETAIYDRIRAAIAARTLPPGMRLREVELCGIFGASRGNVRKALARLAFDGLVNREPNRGATVAKPTPKQAEDLFAARKCIETTIARAAAQRLTKRDIVHLQSHIDKERRAADAGKQDRIVALSGEFHVLLAAIADNSVLERYLVDLVARESLIIQLYERPGGANCAHDEHSGILEALISGEEALIDARIAAHIESIARGLDLQARPEAEPRLEDVLGPRVRA